MDEIEHYKSARSFSGNYKMQVHQPHSSISFHQASIFNLPDDILINVILSFLQCDDVVKMSVLSSHLRAMVIHYVNTINRNLGIPIALNNGPFLSAFGEFMSSASDHIVGVYHHIFDITAMATTSALTGKSMKFLRAFINSEGLKIKTTRRCCSKKNIIKDIQSEFDQDANATGPISVDLDAVGSLIQKQAGNDGNQSGYLYGDRKELYCNELDILEDADNEQQVVIRMTLGYDSNGIRGEPKYRGNDKRKYPQTPSWPTSDQFKSELQS